MKHLRKAESIAIPVVFGVIFGLLGLIHSLADRGRRQRDLDRRASLDRLRPEIAELEEKLAALQVKYTPWLVRDVVFGKASTLETARARFRGEEAWPHLLEILRDKQERSRLVAPEGAAMLAESPFSRLCDLFGDAPPPEAAAALGEFVTDDAAEIRKKAALVLGKIGTAAVIAPLQQSLSDSDEYVRSYALAGLGQAASNGRLSKEVRSALYEDVARLLSAGKNARDAAELLFQFDEDRAAGFLTSPAILATDSPCLQEALDALGRHKRPVPREKLLELAGLLELNLPAARAAGALGQVLAKLGLYCHAEDAPTLRAHLAANEKEIVKGAARGLLSWHGLDGFEERIWKAPKEKTLNATQRQWMAVALFQAEVNNGGLSQYFQNTAGDSWPDALAGLEAIGSNERARILREALAKFGERQPSMERQARQAQLTELTLQHGDLFAALEDRYFQCPEDVEILSLLHVLKNQNAFK